MSLGLGALVVALMVAAGWWPMRRLAGSWTGPGLAERSAVALALGAAATGLCQLALSAVGLPSTLVVPAVLAAVSLLLGRIAPGEREGDEPVETLPVALRLLLTLVALLSVGAAVGTPFSADGVRIWSAKARDLALDGASQAPSLHDAERFGVHRAYPLLLPALLAPVFAHAGPDAAAGAKLVLAALNLALLGALAALLRRCGPRGAALLAAFACVPFLAQLDVRESAVAGGYADSGDALYLLLVVAGLLRLRDTVRPGRERLLVGLAGAALVSTKLEGGVELLIAVTAALLTGGRRRAVLEAAALALLLALPTFLIRAGVSGGDEGFDPSLLLDAAAVRARALPIAAGLLGLALDASSFALLPLLLLWWLRPGAVPSPTHTQRATRAFALWMMAGAIAFLCVAYASTAMIPGRHMYTSEHRLAWHWLAALTLLVARLAPGTAAHPAPVAVPGAASGVAHQEPGR